MRLTCTGAAPPCTLWRGSYGTQWVMGVMGECLCGVQCLNGTLAGG